ncbi:MAG TPA: serine/threonine-protein kinase [Byssovorax sp.]
MSLPPSTTASEPKLVAGRLVDGKYRLASQLGHGGMSRVWLARHEALKTDVAVKFVDEKLLDDETRDLTLERFRFEAQISARLGAKTKHVVSVQDAGAFDGMPYLVMELVSGHHVEQEFERNGPVDIARMASILEQVGDALAVAHEVGIVHRDVKPSNIVLVDTEDGSLFVKVADFGVAKATRSSAAFDRPTETNQGFMVGSPAYMSPEQLRAGGGIDARTDVWGLGVVAYEALTGQLPFVGVSEADLIVLISTAPHEPIASHRPDIGTKLDAWFERALAKDPDERFQDVRTCARSFRACIEEPRESPAPLPAGVELGADVAAGVPVRRFRVGYLAAAVAVFAALALGVAFLRPSPQSTAATSSPNVVAVATAPAPPSEPAAATAEAKAAPSDATSAAREASTSAPEPDPMPRARARAGRAAAPHAGAKDAQPHATPGPRKSINPSEIQ